MKIFINEIDWLRNRDHGWGNGYVIIPKGHPLNGVYYDYINVNVHGGLTFSESVENCKDIFDGLDENDAGGWVVGFDTAHHRDTLENWPKQRVIEETERLREQLEKYSSGWMDAFINSPVHLSDDDLNSMVEYFEENYKISKK